MPGCLWLDTRRQHAADAPRDRDVGLCQRRMPHKGRGLRELAFHARARITLLPRSLLLRAPHSRRHDHLNASHRTTNDRECEEGKGANRTHRVSHGNHDPVSILGILTSTRGGSQENRGLPDHDRPLPTVTREPRSPPGVKAKPLHSTPLLGILTSTRGGRQENRGLPDHDRPLPTVTREPRSPPGVKAKPLRGRSDVSWPRLWLREVTRAHRAVRPDPGHRRVLAELVSPNQPVSRAVLEQARSSTWLKACAECAAGREPLSDVPL